MIQKPLPPEWAFLDDGYPLRPAVGETCALFYCKPLVLLGAAVIALALIGYGSHKMLHRINKRTLK